MGAGVFLLLLACHLSVLQEREARYHAALRERDRQAVFRLPPPPAMVTRELARARQELGLAKGLLEKCFGAKIDLHLLRSLPVTITAYSSTPDQCDDTPYLTASHHPVRVGVLAASDDLFEEYGLHFGQRVLIPGYGLFEVRDRMHPRWRQRVDIWESDREAALHFGRQEGTLIWLSSREKLPLTASADEEENLPKEDL